MTRKRLMGWILGSIAALLVLVAVAGFFILRSNAFHQYVLAKIVQKAEEATGGQVQIQSFDFHWRNLTADVYGLIIRGTEKDQNHPLLAIDKLSVNIKIVSALQRKVDLNEIIIQHPVVHLISDKNGRSNIPQPKVPTKDNQPVNVFDLGIKHVLLTNGEIYYNQERTPLQADLHDLETEIQYKILQSRYTGSMSYRNGRLLMGNSAPLPHDLNATFIATPSLFSLNPAVLKIGSSQIRLEANVSDFGNPKVDGTYQVLLHMQDFKALMTDSSLPAGNIDLSGALRYQNVAVQPFLRNVVVEGRLDSRQLDVVLPQARAVVRSLHGQYKLINGNLQASDIGADLLGGHLSAELSMQHIDATPVSRLRASVRAISLRSAREVAKSEQLKRMPVTGRIDGMAEASWIGSVRNLRAKSDVILKAAVEQSSATRNNLLPVDGIIHMNYDGARNIITLRDSYFRTPQTLIGIHGSVSDRSDLRIQAKTGDLNELNSLAAALQTPNNQTASGSTPVRTLSISGSAALTGVMQGSLKNPRISGQVTAQNLLVDGSQWRDLQFAIQACPSGITVQRGSLVAARQGQAFFSLNLGLRQWKYFPSNPISASLTVRQMPVNQLQKLAKLDYPVSGNLSADISLHGSQLNPMGNGSAQLSQARVYNQAIQNLSLQFKAAGNSVTSDLVAKIPAGSATAHLIYYPKNQGYELQMNAPVINLARLDAVQQRNLGLTGMLSASATGKGTLADPQVAATLQVPTLQVRQASVNHVKAQLNVVNHRADITLDSELANAFVQARSTINLNDNYYTVATLDTKGLPLAPLIALYKPVPPQFQGQLEFHASAKGPLKDRSRMEAHLVIRTLTAAYQSIQIANAGPIQIDYADSVARIAPSEIRGTGTSVRFDGEIPLKGSAPPRLNLLGSIDMQLLRILSPEVQSSGKLALDLHATRSSNANLGVQGQLRMQNISLAAASAPMGIDNLNGLFDIQNNEIQVSHLAGQLGGGQITATGAVIYKPQMQFNLALNANGVRLRYPEGVRTILGGDLTLTGTPQDSNLDGRVLVDNLSFTQDFDLADFIGQFSGNSAPPTGEGFIQNLKLNVAVQTTSQLNLVSSTLSLQGQANLRVIGTGADPVITGRASLNSGEMFFMKQRYQLQRGIIDFVNPNQTELVVNLLLTTAVQQYNLSLNFIGPLDRLRTEYTSEPPLPPVDIINLLARGQTTEEAAPANLDANSVLAQGLAGQVSSRLQKLAGISSLQIDPTIGGNGTNPGARVALQQRVTKNFIFTFSTDVADAQSEVVQGEYQISKRWSVAAARDQYGGMSVNAKFHKVF